MKKLLAIAAFLLASSAAQAQYTFQYGGQTIHIDPDRGTVSIPGVYDNTGRKPKRARKDEDSSRKQDTPPQEAKVDPQPAPPSQQPAPADTAAAPISPPAPPAPAPAANAAPPSATTAGNAPAETAVLPPPAPSGPPPAPVPATQVQQPPPAPSVAAIAPPAPAPVAVAPAPRDPNSPVGIWLTEEKEGKVRIEQCGANLCGYSVDAKSNANGEQVLINMKPGRDQKWSGRILDPNSGSTYDSTIAMRGTDTLRVQGCAFGGMFCGGQTWTRVN
jgi:uncharacterized protein (DUF2147 family)